MKVLRVNLRDPRQVERAVEEALRVLKGGGIVVIPTETVYGVASLIEYAERIFEIKGRPKSKPLPVQISSLEQASFAEVNERVRKLAGLWPGPLTIVTKARGLPSYVTAGTGKVGMRIPDHPFTLELLKRTPLVVTSANKSGRPSPLSVEEVEIEYDLAIDTGPSPYGIESTVIDVTGKRPRILRQGPITKELLEQTLGEKVEGEERPRTVKVKGEFYYAEKPCINVCEGIVVGPEELIRDLPCEKISLGSLREPLEIARRTWRVIREVEGKRATFILPPPEGVLKAVREILKGISKGRVC